MSKKWAIKSLPKFNGLKALVLPGAFYASAVQLMAEAGFAKAGTVKEADVIVFMGGADVDPKTYGDKPLSYTSSIAIRDESERVIYDEAQELGKVCFGICRGAQILHAFNGGKLWQHVEGHAGFDHDIYDLDEDVTVTANSYHHQMLMDSKDLEIVAVTSEQVSKKFFADGMTVRLDEEGANQMAEMEIEAGAYNKTRCFFVQGHPEVGNDEYRAWCLHKLMDYIQDWKGASLTRDKHNQLSVNEQLQQWRDAQ